MSLTLVINLSIRIYSRIFGKNLNDFNRVFMAMGLGETDLRTKQKAENLVSDSLAVALE
jgi:hypothetical protein